MKRKNNLYIDAILLALIFLLISQGAISGTFAQKRAATQAPRFEVDPLWPKPLPNHWVLGSVTGVAVDGQDHIWIVHRGADSLGNNEKGAILNPPTGCCVPAPPVLEFDQAGNLVSHWGGPGQGYEWPQATGGMAIDHKGNVWIAAAGAEPAAARPGAAQAAPRPQDAHVLKFSRAGQFLLQIGHAGKTEPNDSRTGLNRPIGVSVDAATNEVYVADTGNRRVVVFDADTGAYKRHWGAYGEKPDSSALGSYNPNAPPAKQFRTASNIAIAKDGMVYVCDRANDRIQVFQKDGKFVKEAFVSKTTLGDGSVWDIAFSHDPQQRFLYVADGHDKKIFILRRDTLEAVASFGSGGRMPGQFYGVCGIAVDSRGNIYTVETYEGKRVQKFIYKGLSAVSQNL
ncbi:MAG TPA: beta-propeller fold lactonase family protein [Blastocatellia bacterium]